ncbi:class I SAM-dependent DNA methyltransferase [Cytobacillus dafuensis]|uniref:Class I SAM-dependent methyltransferase n=1 Tax=Cytobacillus dafuensis TaxID=1742359 RepID=A0A5B8Z6V9_CYTDA|nr:class I SAM-dependent methyltransferase [Cytobacillus dafuensis]QED48708.1 class I SAM-dependent methyltransferase [Cytobacillus dafuensis]
MSYGKFAYLYDELMKDVPYNKWVELVEKKTKKYNLNGNNLLDLACGTAELSVQLAEKSFNVVGVDLSEDMLTVAQSKAIEKGQDIKFYQQNMAELDGLGQFDIICIFCDSLNYLQSEKDVLDTFHSVHHHLAENGLFLFDVHSIYKIMQIFMNQTFAVNDDEISYIWHCYQGEFPNSVEHDLSFFVLDEESDLYERYNELHFQRTFPIDVYEGWLKKAGFELLEITSDFEDVPPQTHSERIFFTCRKARS